MKILFLTRRFVDGDEVSEHIKALSQYLVEKGHESVILAFEEGSCSVEGFRVEKVSVFYEGDSFYSWSMMLNNELKHRARELLEEEAFDLIHAHDWVTVSGGLALKKRFELPTVLTVHSTEHERGFNDPNSSVISEMEWKGAQNADKLLANNEDTMNSLIHDLDAESGKIQVVDPLNSGWTEKILKTYEELVKLEEIDAETVKN